MGHFTRRGFLLSLCAAARASAAKGTVFPSEWRRYADPTTEFQVYRLTDPAHTSVLPPLWARPITRSFLLFSSDRTGAPQAFRMDLAKGECRQLTDSAALDPASLALHPAGRGFCYFDARALHYCAFPSLRDRRIYTVPSGWERCQGVSISGDGRFVLFGESSGDGSRLRRVSLAGAPPRTLVQAPFALSAPVSRPRRAQVLYRDGDSALWLVNSETRQNRLLKTAPGRIGTAGWSADGRSILYLNFPDAGLNTIREIVPDTNADTLVAKTSQFASFAFNRDASVFAGASRNQGSPTVLLMLRVTRRELTLCEHKAADAAAVAPLFSPDSQRVYFQSDRHGKPAVYCLPLERLVEKTEGA